MRIYFRSDLAYVVVADGSFLCIGTKKDAEEANAEELAFMFVEARVYDSVVFLLPRKTLH